MKLLAIIGIAFALSASTSQAETFQLKTVDRVDKAGAIEELSAEQLLEREQVKRFVISFLRANAEDKFLMTSEKYRKLNRGSDSLKKIFNKESYDRLDFQEVKLFNRELTKHSSVKANLHWFAEGYEGVQTMYFMLIKEKDRWLLDWLVY